jgi:hypothetical protein
MYNIPDDFEFLIDKVNDIEDKIKILKNRENNVSSILTQINNRLVNIYKDDK